MPSTSKPGDQYYEVLENAASVSLESPSPVRHVVRVIAWCVTVSGHRPIVQSFLPIIHIFVTDTFSADERERLILSRSL